MKKLIALSCIFVALGLSGCSSGLTPQASSEVTATGVDPAVLELAGAYYVAREGLTETTYVEGQGNAASGSRGEGVAASRTYEPKGVETTVELEKALLAAGLSAEEIAAAREGRIFRGMQVAGVVAAIGVPPYESPWWFKAENIVLHYPSTGKNFLVVEFEGGVVSQWREELSSMAGPFVHRPLITVKDNTLEAPPAI
ncbi:MAG: hypothetical protein Q7P63_10705 [Verrucomicrobiota bacterium JB022]|nr:hypothetical protein [Verrucomicrobiota bacterium JB022]